MKGVIIQRGRYNVIGLHVRVYYVRGVVLGTYWCITVRSSKDSIDHKYRSFGLEHYTKTETTALQRWESMYGVVPRVTEEELNKFPLQPRHAHTHIHTHTLHMYAHTHVTGSVFSSAAMVRELD